MEIACGSFVELDGPKNGRCRRICKGRKAENMGSWKAQLN
jgi:hypothetical protein